MIKKVFLDMDGVLTDFHKGVCDAFDHEYVLDNMMRYDFWEDWGGPDVTRGNVNDVCNQAFWEDLEWMHDGKEILRIVENAYGRENVFLITLPMPNAGSWTGKRIWVERMAPDYRDRLIVTVVSKAIFASPDTLLIDDKNENVDGFVASGGNAILIPRPWNRLKGREVISYLKGSLYKFHHSYAFLEAARERLDNANQQALDQAIDDACQQLKSSEKVKETKMQIPVRLRDYMLLSDAYDTHSRTLMIEKGGEYSVENDFLCMENRLAGMTGDEPEKVSLVMAGKHITSLGIILEKQDPEEINLAKWDERIRDAMNLLKITAAFIHAKQNDFSLHLGKKECQENVAVD